MSTERRGAVPLLSATLPVAVTCHGFSWIPDLWACSLDLNQ